MATVAAAPSAVLAEVRPKPAFSSRLHLEGLDGLRGVACLAVIVYHVALSLETSFGYHNAVTRILDAGWAGVDLFFVLSGFLITGILWESRTGPHYFRNFYARRTLRIFPLYFGVLGLIAVARLAAHSPDPMQGWTWTYLTNAGIAKYGFVPFNFLCHFWSLAVEEHFYLLWPLVVLAIPSRTALLKTALGTCALVLGFRITAILYGAPPLAVYVLTPFRLDALLFGCTLALLARGPGGIRQLRTLGRILTPTASAGLLSLAWLRGGLDFQDPWVQTLGFTLLAALGGGLLIECIAGGWFRRLMSLSPLKSAGKYSYGLYVWHPLLLHLLFHTNIGRRLFFVGGPVMKMVVPVAVFSVALPAVSLISWHFGEKHFLKLKHYFDSPAT